MEMIVDSFADGGDRHGRGYYGRTLARVYLDGADLASELLRRHLARPYLPGRDGGWC